MKKLSSSLLTLIGIVLMSLFVTKGSAQDTTLEKRIVDVVWLKDGSKLSGTILKWDLARGMVLKLITGAEVNIPKEQISKVYQDTPFIADPFSDAVEDTSDPGNYTKFREEGLYNNFSCFLNFSQFGGAGIHYSMGHRFNRLLGVGMGIGFESNDFTSSRAIIPLYVEARGFLVSSRITPYYALKIGYGFALRNEFNGTIGASGGLHFCPEFGVRFGGRNMNYYMGLEYKIQNATFTTRNDWNGGQFTDVVSYRRTELRMGLLF